MIQLLVGMIASGKTTYARRQAKKGALIISHDDLTEMLHGEYRYEPELRPVYLAMMVQIAHNAIVAGRDVIVDRTHLTREARSFWLNIAWHSKVEIDAIKFPSRTPEVHAKRRFEADARGRSLEEWLKVATHHSDQEWLEPLRDVEGFRSIIRLA